MPDVFTVFLNTDDDAKKILRTAKSPPLADICHTPPPPPSYPHPLHLLGFALIGT